jgi:hypothetical protein
VYHPKHVEQLRNIRIINSTSLLHLVGSFYEIYITMHGSMNIMLIHCNNLIPSYVFPFTTLNVYCRDVKVIALCISKDPVVGNGLISSVTLYPNQKLINRENSYRVFYNRLKTIFYLISVFVLLHDFTSFVVFTSHINCRTVGLYNLWYRTQCLGKCATAWKNLISQLWRKKAFKATGQNYYTPFEKNNAIAFPVWVSLLSIKMEV